MMNAFSVPEGQEIAERFDFTPYQCVLDVAGGPGGIVVQIGLRYPHLRGIIMDMAPVCEVAEEYIQASGLTGRFATAAADLFTGPYPQGADVIVLGHILHNWSDDSCRKILRNCFEALPTQGVLLVSQKVLNNDFSGTRFALMLDLTMLVAAESGARARSEAEYGSLLEEAGFRDWVAAGRGRVSRYGGRTNRSAARSDRCPKAMSRVGYTEARPTHPVELTAHSARFLAVACVFSCGPQLTGSVRRSARIQGRNRKSPLSE